MSVRRAATSRDKEDSLEQHRHLSRHINYLDEGCPLYPRNDLGATSSGFGWQSMLTVVRLWEFMFATAGSHCANKLWQSLPPVYRQCAVCYTDFWEAYEQVLPSKRHRAVGKETGKTNSIERFNNTLRQRVGRLVRKTLSFSKKLSNHIGAIWYFEHHYNASLQS